MMSSRPTCSPKDPAWTMTVPWGGSFCLPQKGMAGAADDEIEPGRFRRDLLFGGESEMAQKEKQIHLTSMLSDDLARQGAEVISVTDAFEKRAVVLLVQLIP